MSSEQGINVLDADRMIAACLESNPRQSFFLFAGAGSGKTRSLVGALGALRLECSKTMRKSGRQIAVITYTNAACDEISRRVDFDPLINISTIHSFVWRMVEGFNDDIRVWLADNLRHEIAELNAELAKGKPGTKTEKKRQAKKEAKQRRLARLPSITKFVYNPNGDNRGIDSLHHAEVISAGSSFISSSSLMQELLINQHPIVFIDESQDTNKHLISALMNVQATHSVRFTLGLFGDMMQRIYSDGKADLGSNLPRDWATPAKIVNYRCPKRIVTLINQIRSEVDDHVQSPAPDASEGIVRLFIASSGRDQETTESVVRGRMAEISGDARWIEQGAVKALVLEHHMAARRMGFAEVFVPLYRIERFKTSLRDGKLPLVRFFSDLVLPLVTAGLKKDEFAVAAIVRRESPILSDERLRATAIDQAAQLDLAQKAVDGLLRLFADDAMPTCSDVLQQVALSGLFEIPDVLQPFVDKDDQAASARNTVEEDEEDDEPDDILTAIGQFLSASFNQIEKYVSYVTGNAEFGTHQGVKGLEFPRVLVVMDDEEAAGFMFSYDKLFRVKSQTKTDIENEASGEDTGISRTRRLFYVTCSRAENGLALVAYSSNPSKLLQSVIAAKWFEESEIELIK